jgi:hypothetical protein
MPKVYLDLDARVLSRLRAAANREGVVLDDIANRLLGGALRTPMSTANATKARAQPTRYEYEEPDAGVDDENHNTHEHHDCHEATHGRYLDNGGVSEPGEPLEPVHSPEH